MNQNPVERKQSIGSSTVFSAQRSQAADVPEDAESTYSFSQQSSSSQYYPGANTLASIILSEPSAPPPASCPPPPPTVVHEPPRPNPGMKIETYPPLRNLSSDVDSDITPASPQHPTHLSHHHHHHHLHHQQQQPALSPAADFNPFHLSPDAYARKEKNKGFKKAISGMFQRPRARSSNSKSYAESDGAGSGSEYYSGTEDMNASSSLRESESLFSGQSSVKSGQQSVHKSTASSGNISHESQGWKPHWAPQWTKSSHWNSKSVFSHFHFGGYWMLTSGLNRVTHYHPCTFCSVFALIQPFFDNLSRQPCVTLSVP